MDDLQKENLKKLHEAARFFRETAERFGFKNTLVLWGTVLEDDYLLTGLTFSDGMKGRDFESLCFKLLGRTYNCVDFDDEDFE